MKSFLQQADLPALDDYLRIYNYLCWSSLKTGKCLSHQLLKYYGKNINSQDTMYGFDMWVLTLCSFLHFLFFNFPVSKLVIIELIAGTINRTYYIHSRYYSRYCLRSCKEFNS